MRIFLQLCNGYTQKSTISLEREIDFTERALNHQVGSLRGQGDCTKPIHPILRPPELTFPTQ